MRTLDDQDVPVTQIVLDTTTRSRALVLGACVIAFSTFMVMASFNYMLAPMLADLDLTTEQGNLALKIPSLASLLVVFAAGRLGDRLGHRAVIVTLGCVFIVGSAVVMLAQGIGMLALGMFLESMAGTGIQIVVIGLLAAHFVEPRARAAAFATFGMTLPATYLSVPVIAGWLATSMSWRTVPLLWVTFGVIMLATAWFVLPRGSRLPLGELWTPLLAGLFAVGVMQFISHTGDYGITSPRALVALIVMAGSFTSCAILLRKFRTPSLSLTPLKNGATAIILIVVLLVPMLNTFFYVTIVLQYMYGMTAFATAVLMIPAQAASIVGAKVVSERMTDRFGITRSGITLLLALGVVMAMPITFTTSTPIWQVLVFVSLFGALVNAIGVVALNALMSSAPPEESGNTAAFQGSAVEIGIALGVVVMSTLVFNVGRASLANGLEDSGLSTESAAVVMAEIQENSASPLITARYSYPLPDGGDASEVHKAAILDGLRANGVAGVAVALVGAGLFAIHRRRPQTALG